MAPAPASFKVWLEDGRIGKDRGYSGDGFTQSSRGLHARLPDTGFPFGNWARYQLVNGFGPWTERPYQLDLDGMDGRRAAGVALRMSFPGRRGVVPFVRSRLQAEPNGNSAA